MNYAIGMDPLGIAWIGSIITILAVTLLQYQPSEPTTNNSIYDVDAARKAYSDGKISLEEMERRVDVALDPRSKQLRTYAEEVRGVGPEISAALSGEYRTIEEVANASQSDLERIYGIGPNTAYAIKQQFSHEKSTPPSEAEYTDGEKSQ
ncbi:helix-hairpin-helix domain-containing protein [Natrinema soli]|uniref:Helix-hairpin-helix domain-containing protein n=1 Tax=Natrinema soli TaxID=1930624 RepID=A0ABD5SLU4_9EURY|nr:helix-hairpin-helix domain-containing protein [Natrinema soli]